MKKKLLPILKTLKKIRAINFLLRVFAASKYYNRRYSQILYWGIHSKEDTNYTYPLTEKNMLYLANTIAIVTDKSVQEVMKYLEEVENNHELKQHIIQQTNTSSERFFADSRCDFGKRLGWYALARITKPKVIIETGVDKGLGGVLLCAALLKNKEEGFEGAYYGTDINPKAGYLITGKYATVGKLLYGDSIESLQKFPMKIDLFINDSDHSSEYEYREYQTIVSKLSNHCIILGDNAHVTDKLAKFSYEQSRKFIFFKEEPKNHWYPGGGIGISY
jgi:predicted O-methyltransferase YrrM